MTRPYKRGPLCSHCDEPRAPGHRWCAKHKAEYMRDWRQRRDEEFKRLRRIVRNVSRGTVDAELRKV